MLQEIAEMGFEYAELSHGIRVSLMPGIMDAVDSGVIKISTLHNFCPLPVGVNHAAPNIYEFSSEDQRERKNAFKHTIKTIEFAKRVGAKLIVMHSGSMTFKKGFPGGLFGGKEEFTDRLVDLLEGEAGGSEEFNQLVARAMECQEKFKEIPTKRSLEMLQKIATVAGEQGLMLGIENREALEEIPIDADFGEFLGQLPDNARYWHDCGHGQIKENLGFTNHRAQVDDMSNRLGGFHIHDVAFPGKDHQPPGAGMIDFEGLKPFVSPEHIKVFEISPGLERDEVQKGVAHLKSIWGDD